MTKITNLPPHKNPAVADQVAIVDNANVITKRITMQDLSAIMATLLQPSGMVQQFAGASSPAGWLICDGSAISRSTYAALFAVIGTTYGSGNGTTTFNIPDFRQRFPLGKAASGTGATLGEAGGQIDHRHGAGNAGGEISTGATNTGFGAGDLRGAIGASASDANRIGYTAVGAFMPDGGSRPAQTFSGTWANASSGRTDWNHFIPIFGYTNQNNPPYLSVNFIIKT